jgi:hypothetical protein
MPNSMATTPPALRAVTFSPLQNNAQKKAPKRGAEGEGHHPGKLALPDRCIKREHPQGPSHYPFEGQN